MIFLYGVGAAQSGYSLSAFIVGATLGFAAAGLTYGTILLARRYLSARIFFGATEILLLCLGAALALATLDGVTSLGLLPEDWPGILYDPLWDSSALLADNALGGLLPAFTGYRSRPSLLEVGVFALYWLIVAVLTLRQPATQPVRA
jgi:high-affinity iron transporter